MTDDAVSRARADLQDGRAWKARDRLVGVLTQRQDDEVLDLLAATYAEMLDLPAAGALFFVTGRQGELPDQCLEAWHERHGSPRSRWQSIPAPVRTHRTDAQLEALRTEADAGTSSGRSTGKHTSSDDEPSTAAACLTVLGILLVLGAAVVGVVFSLVWLFGRV